MGLNIESLFQGQIEGTCGGKRPCAQTVAQEWQDMHWEQSVQWQGNFWGSWQLQLLLGPCVFSAVARCCKNPLVSSCGKNAAPSSCCSSFSVRHFVVSSMVLRRRPSPSKRQGLGQPVHFTLWFLNSVAEAFTRPHKTHPNMSPGAAPITRLPDSCLIGGGLRQTALMLGMDEKSVGTDWMHQSPRF